MSVSNIVSSNNLSVGGTFTLIGNAIIGASNSYTAVFNSVCSFLSGMTTNGITNTGTISTTALSVSGSSATAGITDTGTISTTGLSVSGNTTLNNLTVSGSNTLNTITSTNIYGNTIYSTGLNIGASGLYNSATLLYNSSGTYLQVPTVYLTDTTQTDNKSLGYSTSATISTGFQNSSVLYDATHTLNYEYQIYTFQIPTGGLWKIESDITFSISSDNDTTKLKQHRAYHTLDYATNLGNSVYQTYARTIINSLPFNTIHNEAVVRTTSANKNITICIMNTYSEASTYFTTTISEYRYTITRLK